MSEWLSGDLRGQLHIIVEALKSGDVYGKLDTMHMLEFYKALVEQAKGPVSLATQADTTVKLRDSWHARVQEILADEARIGEFRACG